MTKLHLYMVGVVVAAGGIVLSRYIDPSGGALITGAGMWLIGRAQTELLPPPKDEPKA